MATVEHVNIVDPFIHEPKGVSTANAGEVYIADGSASGAWGKKETYGAVNGINTRTGSYTLVAADAGYLILMNLSTSGNLTVPPNASVAFPVGTRIDVVQTGTGETTIEAGSGVTIRSMNDSVIIAEQYGAVSLVKIGTNEWILAGQLL